MKKLFSRRSFLPDRTNHYDEHGEKIGYSRTTLFGYTNHYDEKGHKVGYRLIAFHIANMRHDRGCFH